MHLFVALLCVVLLSPSNARTDRALAPHGRVSHLTDDNFSGHGQTDNPGLPQHRPNHGARSSGGPACTLKVQVSDLLSRQGLDQTRVEVYVDQARAATGLTGGDGVVLLTLPYQQGAPSVVVVASKEGYLLTASPWKPERMPIFSSISMSLLALSKGNIWLYEDSVLINGKTSDALFQPSVEFPQSLLNRSMSSDPSSLSALFTAPVLRSGDEDPPLSISTITTSTSGHAQVELRAVAAVCVQLFSGGAELQVTGPLRLSLPLEPGWGLQSGDHVPAWRFNRTSGGWMRGGLGTVVSSRGKLVWTFMAPHLGYWVAAPLPSTRRSKDLSVAIDFLFQHCLSIMAALGAALLVLLLLLVSVCCCSQTRPKGLVPARPPSRRDQSTSTHGRDVFQVPVRDSSPDRERLLNPSAAGSSGTRHRAEPDFFQENSMAIEMESLTEGNPGRPDHLTRRPDHLTHPADHLSGFSQQQLGASLSLDDSLFFYNQPIAILHAPAFFSVGEEAEPCGGSAPSPRPPPSNPETTAQSAAPSLQNQTVAANAETPPAASALPPDAAATPSTSRGPHLPESASVPGTLNKARDKRLSCSGPSPLPPRAWFVSLEGKPAAEIHRAVGDQHRRQRRPTESRDASLDSGVDLTELNPPAGGRRSGPGLERSDTFVRRGQQP